MLELTRSCLSVLDSVEVRWRDRSIESRNVRDETLARGRQREQLRERRQELWGQLRTQAVEQKDTYLHIRNRIVTKFVIGEMIGSCWAPSCTTADHCYTPMFN